MSDLPGKIKEAFTGQRGKVLLAVGAGLTVFLWWQWRQQDGTAGTDPGTDGVDGGWAGVGGSGSGSGSVPVTTDPSGGTDAGTTGRPTTNAAWLSQGHDLLVSLGTPSASAHTALSLALAGQPMTAAQVALVSLVMARLGTPPDGMPPMTTTPSPGGGGGGGTPPPATGRHHTVKSGDTLWSISIKYYGTPSKSSAIYAANAATIDAAARSHGKTSSDHGHWIYPGTVLTIP